MTEQRSWRPYLIRAIYEWIGDVDQTPHILVDVSVPGVVVPAAHVKDERIVLNISASATQHLALGNAEISFKTRFDGREQQVSVPVAAVMGIYSRETGQGMVFTGDEPGGSPDSKSGVPKAVSRPTLKVVK